MRLLLGPVGAPLYEEVLRVYADQVRQCPNSDRQVWLVVNQVEAARLTGMLAARLGGILAPGVKPLHQAADAIVGAAAEPMTPLSVAARSRLIEEALHRGSFSGRYRLLLEARGSAGGLDYVGAAIRQFALANLDPAEVLDQAGALRDPRMTELARAYQDYQRECARHNLLDRETRLRRACELCETGNFPGGRLSVAAASGLDAMAPLESRFLQAVFGVSDQCVAAFSVDRSASLEIGGEVATPAPYRGPAVTVRRLQTRFPQCRIEWVESALPAADGRLHALAGLFRDPREVQPAVDAGPQSAIRLLGAKGLQPEAVAAAHRVKRLLQAGCSADQVVVATRNLGGWAPRLREAFAQAGVPLAIEGASTLGESAVGRAMGLLLRLASDDWPFDAVHSAVTSPRLALMDAPLSESEWGIATRLGFAGRRAATEWVVNELLYPKGRRALLDRVTWLASSDAGAGHAEAAGEETEGRSLDRRRQRLAAAATLAAPSLARLAEVTQGFYGEATPLEWHDRIVAALEVLGYRSIDDASAAHDGAAIDALEGAFASLEQLGEQRGVPVQAAPLAEAQRLVQGWMSRVTINARWDAEGRVRLMSAETASHTPCEHLLLVGLDEASFPRADASLPLGDDAQSLRHQSSEMLLFCRLLAAPRKAVWLSYAALDEKAQTLNPSSFVGELERLFPSGSLRQDEQDADAAPQDVQQLRRQAVRSLLEGDNGPLAQLAGGGGAAALIAGLTASHDRSGGDSFGVYEGVLQSDRARELLATRFGPEHLWSASQLEQYGTCPFKFYLRHVLHADPVESLALDVDYRRRGSLLHDAMVRFHRRVNDLVGHGAAPSTLDADAFTAAFSLAVEEAFAALATASHETAVAEIEKLQAAAWSAEYQRQHARYDQKNAGFDEPLTPRHFEARFGPEVAAADEPPDPLSTPEPYALQAGDLEILLTGQVDRIDVGRVAGQTVFSVIDYKTARYLTLKQEDIESGRLLQLVLYTLAVSDHLLAGQDAAPWRSGYWAVQNDGFKFGKLPQPGVREEGVVGVSPEWGELVESVRQRVGQIVTDVRMARFPMHNLDEDCGGRCEYRTVCRVAQARSLGKTPTWEGP